MSFLPKSKLGWIRVGVLVLILLGLVVYFFVIPAVRYALYSPEEGDIVFQSLPRTDLSVAIEGISQSNYSHCGVVVKEDGKWLVVEALGDVHKTSLFTWVMRSRTGRFAAYRLKPEYRASIPKFVSALQPFLGRYYDFKYEMDDEFIYCSELAWKAWRSATGEELGTLVKLGDMNWKPFEETIRKYEQGPPPLDRMMITPRGLSEARQLEKVFGGAF